MQKHTNNFLIINPFGIGDVLFTTPIISALKEKYPDAKIGFWCNERVKDLLKNNPNIDKVFAMSRGDIKRIYKRNPVKAFFALSGLLEEIRKEKFGMSFDLSLDSRYGLWSQFAGVKKRVGFDYKKRGRFLTDKVQLEGYSSAHMVDYYTSLLKFIGIEPKDKALNLTVTEENKAKAQKLLAEFGVEPGDLVVGIAMGGGASWGHNAVYKQWPIKSFSKLTDQLIRKENAYVALIGNADEEWLADVIVSEIKSPNVIDLTGKVSLEILAAIIKELKFLVSNDGGPLHMAVALGVRTVSIFGPVDDKVYGPYPQNGNHIVVKTETPCRPCYENFRFPGCLNDKRCLEEVTVDEVYEKVKAFL